MIDDKLIITVIVSRVNLFGDSKVIDERLILHCLSRKCRLRKWSPGGGTESFHLLKYKTVFEDCMPISS